MTKYIVQRILAALPVLLGILFVTFAMARLLPGDPCVAILGEKANEVTCGAFNTRYGLDKPITTQFGIYLRDVLTGDLGMSFRYGQPITRMISERLAVTLELALSAMIVAVIGGMLLGIISAKNHGSGVDVGHDGGRQPGRIGPRVRARPFFGLRICDPAEGYPLRFAPIGPPVGRHERAFYRKGA